MTANTTANATAANVSGNSGNSTMSADYAYVQVERRLNKSQRNRVEKTVNTIIKVSDKGEKDGKIDWKEALAIFKKGVKRGNPNITDADFKKLRKMYRKIFNKFDKDNSGDLDKEELRKVVK